MMRAGTTFAWCFLMAQQLPKKQHDFPLAGRPPRRSPGRNVAFDTSWHSWVKPVLLAGALGVAWAPEDAQACSGIYVQDQWSAVAEVPASGGFVLNYTCRAFASDCAGAPESLTILRDGEPVPGTVARIGHNYLFVPESPLEVGAAYEVDGFGVFDAVPASTRDLSSITPFMQLQESYSRESVDRQCCDELRDSCGEVQCVTRWAPEMEARLAILVEMLLEQDDLTSPIIEGRLLWTGGSDNELSTDWQPFSLHTVEGGTLGAVRFTAGQVDLFESHLEQYCLQLELHDLISGAVHRFDESCLAHGDLPIQGSTLPVEETLDTGLLRQCPRPLDGMESEWCEATRDDCDSSGLQQSCERFAEYCPAVSEPDPTSGPGGAGGQSASPPEGEDDPEGEADPDGAETNSDGVDSDGGGAEPNASGGEADASTSSRASRSSGGCSLTTAGGTTGALGWLWLLGPLALVGRRRRDAA